MAAWKQALARAPGLALNSDSDWREQKCGLSGAAAACGLAMRRAVQPRSGLIP